MAEAEIPRPARERAEHLASLLGVTVGAVNQVVEVSDKGVAGLPVMERLQAGGGFGAAAPSVSGGEITVSSAVQVVFDIAE